MKPPHPDDYFQELGSRPGHVFEPGSEGEQRALERFQNFYRSLNAESARRLTRETYAEDVYFFDSLKTVRGVEALEDYFLETAGNTKAVRVEVLDMARSGADYYVRWVMEIELKRFKRGKTLKSVGLTHLRFNPDGRISMHHDYWDAASGFYQHVPVVGGMIRFIQRRFERG